MKSFAAVLVVAVATIGQLAAAQNSACFLTGDNARVANPLNNAVGCPWYSGSSCCTAQEDADIQATIVRTNDSIQNTSTVQNVQNFQNVNLYLSRRREFLCIVCDPNQSSWTHVALDGSGGTSTSQSSLYVCRQFADRYNFAADHITIQTTNGNVQYQGLFASVPRDRFPEVLATDSCFNGAPGQDGTGDAPVGINTNTNSASAQLPSTVTALLLSVAMAAPAIAARLN